MRYLYVHVFSGAVILSASICIEVMQKMLIWLFSLGKGKQLVSFCYLYLACKQKLCYSEDQLIVFCFFFKGLEFTGWHVTPNLNTSFIFLNESIVTQLKEVCLLKVLCIRR